MSNETVGHEELTLKIADHIVRIANSQRDQNDTEALRRLFLDNFIVSLWGSTRPAASAIATWSRRFAGSGPSPVLGGDWSTDPSIAALVHGTAGHSYELDDTHDETTSHPACVVISAALAVASVTDASQADLFRAVSAGYEAMALIGKTAGGMDTVHRGFHPTSVFGVPQPHASRCTHIRKISRSNVTPSSLHGAMRCLRLARRCSSPRSQQVEKSSAYMPVSAHATV
jgi:2-methylcitrate dehydratase PrpD